MQKETTFIEYCDKCGASLTHHVKKEQLDYRGGGIYTGIFFHKSLSDETVHALLAYFDKQLANRGSEPSIAIKTDAFSSMQEDVTPGLDESKKHELKIFYEWLINSYIQYFYSCPNMRLLGRIKLRPLIVKSLKALKSISEFYENFKLIAGKERDTLVLNSEIDIDERNYNELKNIYKTLFSRIHEYFRTESEKDAIEAARQLGLKVIIQWRDIVKLGLSEDVLSILEESCQ